MTAQVDGKILELKQDAGGTLWESSIKSLTLAEGIYDLKVTAEGSAHRIAWDTVRIVVVRQAYSLIDRKRTALEAWEECVLLGTQQGPNKNGRKWR